MIPIQYALRRRMMGQTSLLPSGYTRVDYIQGTGAQYIDTGFVVNKSDNYALEIDGLFPSQAQKYQGCNGYMQFFVSSKYGISNESSISVGNRDTMRIEYANQTEKLFVNGVQIKSKSWTTYNGSNVKLALFRMGAANNGWYNGAAAQGTIYGYKVWKNNILASECVPCVRNSDGAVGVYDIIQKSFIGNAGSGAFKVPSNLPFMCTVYIKGQGKRGYTYSVDLQNNGIYAAVVINGTQYVNAAEVQVLKGTTITLKTWSLSGGTGQVMYVNGTIVSNGEANSSASYDYVIDKDVVISLFDNSASGVSKCAGAVVLTEDLTTQYTLKIKADGYYPSTGFTITVDGESVNLNTGAAPTYTYTVTAKSVVEIHGKTHTNDDGDPEYQYAYVKNLKGQSISLSSASNVSVWTYYMVPILGNNMLIQTSGGSFPRTVSITLVAPSA